jgi:hypothetical protein
MAKRVTKLSKLEEAVAFGVEYGPTIVNNNDLKIACACYFAVHHFPHLAAELHKLGDEHSCKDADLQTLVGQG